MLLAAAVAAGQRMNQDNRNHRFLNQDWQGRRALIASAPSICVVSTSVVVDASAVNDTQVAEV